MTKKEIVSYYGQEYDNVKHIKGYVNALCERYKKELVKKKQINMKEKLFTMLYNLEDYLEYDRTEIGRELGNFINELQDCNIIIRK
jgi:hypothetical protein